MSKLTKVQPPARYRGEQFNRELNWKLRMSRPSGASMFPRILVMAMLVRARMENPKTIVAYVPPVPKILKVAGPFRRKRKNQPRKPCKAEVEAILRDYSGRPYVRLDNGQIVRANHDVHIGLDFIEQGSTLFADIPSGLVTLREADQKQLPQLSFPHP